MKPAFVRTSIDLPAGLHRQLREAAAREGCSIRALLLRSAERVAAEAQPQRPRRRLSLDPPPVKPAGRRINLDNETAYALIDFP